MLIETLSAAMAGAATHQASATSRTVASDRLKRRNCPEMPPGIGPLTQFARLEARNMPAGGAPITEVCTEN